jgi:TonB family protein
MKRQRDQIIAGIAFLVSAATMLFGQTGIVGSSEQPMYVCSKLHGQPCAEPPRETYAPDPDPDEAKKAGLAGRVVLLAIITEEGKAQRIRVSTPAGHGFDEAAIDCVKRWKFDPGTYEGNPVPVLINLEFNFKPH